MNLLNKTAVALLAVFAFAFTASAENIGVVNLEKVFNEYYKSRIAEQFIQQRAEALRSYMAQMRGQLENLRSEARRLGTNSMNPALAGQERTKASDAAAEALRKVKAKEAEIELYTSESTRDLRALETQKRAEIIADIQREVKRHATMRGYTFIFDVSGKTMNNQPSLLVFPEKNDITAAVVRELNRTAAKPAKKGARK